MHTPAHIILAATLAASLASAANASVVYEWNDMYLTAVRTTGGGPLGIARAGSIIHTSIYDAINSIDRSHQSFNTTVAAAQGADRQAAVAAAGWATMVNIYESNPALLNRINTLYQRQLNSITPSANKDAGIAVGLAAAQAAINRRTNDGFSNNTPYTPGTNPGDWRPGESAPLAANPVGPNWGRVTPFTLNSGNQFRPPAPPTLNSAQYAAAYNEIKDYGSANSTLRTEEQTKAAWFWGNDRDGSWKPPGHLNHMTRQIFDTRSASMADETRLFEQARILAMTNVGLADAVIAAWDAKYETDRDLWRPAAAIRNGDSDGNPATLGDPNWTPLSEAGIGGDPYTPPFPAYISGHSTMAGAHAAIMQAYFGTDNITFTLATDDQDVPGMIKTFNKISDAATDNALSRIWLGVHWRFDCELGLSTGQNVGQWVIDNAFQVPSPAAASCLLIGALAFRRRTRN